MIKKKTTFGIADSATVSGEGALALAADMNIIVVMPRAALDGNLSLLWRPSGSSETPLKQLVINGTAVITSGIQTLVVFYVPMGDIDVLASTAQTGATVIDLEVYGFNEFARF